MSRAFTLVLLLSLSVAPAFSQEAFYPFAIDQDALSGAVDFSFLNHALGPADRLFVREGHFYRVGADLKLRTDDDERVRLFGVNLAFGANFPTATDAPRVARRLRRLGVNLVRLHHMDTQPDSDPNNANSILTSGPYPTLNPVAVSRLRAFLDAFKAEGIYVDLNLHVGYEFRPAVDQVPAMPEGVRFPTQSKPLHIFFPRMVKLQAEFTRKLIKALALEDDPVLALVEIDNETSLLQAWQTGGLDKYLGGDYKTELQRQWNSFLMRKYGSTEALRAAWGTGDPDGPELLTGKWQIEIHPPAQATFELLPDSAPPTVRVEVSEGGAPVILKQAGFSITTERPYLAEAEVRADLPDGASRNVYWDIKQDVSPWRTLKSSNIAVTNRWQKFSMAVPPTFAMDGIGRFGLSVENVDRLVTIRNWSLRQARRRGLSQDETLEAANVSLTGENEIATPARTNDTLLFLADGDAHYLNRILRAVRKTAGPLVAVAGTQMGYGGLLNLDSHATLDYQDNHFYVDHYNFPNVAWDGRDWRIRDASSLGSGLGAFQNMAAAREADRPYTVSEFNQPWPNTHAAEIDPTLAAFAAFQDWDAIVHFAYAHGRSWDVGVPNGFNINGDTTKFPNVGQAAWLFRSGAIHAGKEPVDIPVSQELRLQAGREKRNGNVSGFLHDAIGYDPATAFVHPVRVSREEDTTLRKGARPSAPFRSPRYDSDTGEITYDRDRKLFLIHAPRAAGVFGFVGQEPVTAGAIEVELAPTARGFASMLLTALDQQPLADSAHLLLSTPGYTLRSQPASNPPRPQKLVNYRSAADWWTVEPEPGFPNKPSGNLNGGLPPVWMERVESTVTFHTSAAKLTVVPLGGSGARLTPLSEDDVEPVDGGFRIHLQADGQPFSPWYELVAER